MEDKPHALSTHLQCTTGDFVGGYCIVRKLGKGRFSTVWEATDQQNKPFAIKVYRIGSDNKSSYENEVKIFNTLSSYSVDTGIVPHYIVPYIDTFAHVDKNGTKPRIHPCVVFSSLPASLSGLLKYCNKKYDHGLGQSMVKNIMRQLFTALNYLHSCGIIHTDVKPSNILISHKFEELESNYSMLNVYLSDLGSSSHINSIHSRHVGTTNYLAPELIIESPSFDTPMDIWSAFTMCFELITTDYLFDVYSECEIEYGDDVDNEMIEVEVGDYHEASGESKDNVTDDNYNDGGSDSNGDSNDESDDNISGYVSTDDSSGDLEDEFDQKEINYRHLLLIAKVIGYPPKEFTENARAYYNRHDKLMRNPDITPTLIRNLLADNYDIPEAECVAIEEFLLAGLRYLPEDRITASAALKLPWLA